jgi:predicted acyl esterase
MIGLRQQFQIFSLGVEDGPARLEWLKDRDWFRGRQVLAGTSYPGFA